MLKEAALSVAAPATTAAATSCHTATDVSVTRTRQGGQQWALRILTVLTIFWLALLLTGSYWYPLDPLKMDVAQSLAAPSYEHLLGCDRLGRDVLARIFSGAWHSLMLAFLIIAQAALIGCTLGLLAALQQGVIARMVATLINGLLALPQQLMVILVVGVLGVGLWHSVLALSLFWWIHFARICYCRVVSMQKEAYMVQAVISGESKWSLLRFYLWPQLKSQLILTALLDVGAAILALATLSFLGLATQPPQPEWGSMLFENRAYLQQAPHLLVFPALAIFISALLCNLLGHAYMRAQKPQQQQQQQQHAPNQ